MRRASPGTLIGLSRSPAGDFRVTFNSSPRAAAIELSMRQPGTPLFETRMPAFRQRQLLGC